MKSKIKKFINSKLFVFIITALVFSTIGVSAATLFPSNNVTYDNSASGLNSNNVQTAIDELYNICFPKTAGDSILDKVDIVTSGNGLYKDEYEDRYFYRGASPNNYITFNDETWRIISIENDGTIKIMRDERIGDIAWNTYSNNWNSPARLNTYLNETYYNELNVVAQSQIVGKAWSIGGVTEYNNDLADQINDENSSKWNGKVALATVSEYIRSNSNKSSCGSFSLYTKDVSGCRDTTWMYYSRDGWWTLSHRSNHSSDVFYVDDGGSIGYVEASATNHAVRPTVYLNSMVQITGGDGSQSNPYTIK